MEYIIIISIYINIICIFGNYLAMEEPKVEGNKSKAVIAVVVVFVIVFSAIGFFLFKGEASVEGITALDGYEIADEIAMDWNVNNSLESVRPAGILTDDGKFSAWNYAFSVNINSTTQNSLIVVVNMTGDYTTEEGGPHQVTYYKEISNWTIDSDKAYEIFLNNEEIASFMNNNAFISNFILMNTSSGNSFWYIQSSDISDGTLRMANIEIDATIGEVLHVHVDS